MPRRVVPIWSLPSCFSHGPVEQQVPRHDQVGVAGDAQVLDRQSARAQSVDLAEQDVRVDDYAVADDAGLLGVEDARRG